LFKGYTFDNIFFLIFVFVVFIAGKYDSQFQIEKN